MIKTEVIELSFGIQYWPKWRANVMHPAYLSKEKLAGYRGEILYYIPAFGAEQVN